MERTDGMILSCVLDPMEQINCCQITQPQTTISQNGYSLVSILWHAVLKSWSATTAHGSLSLNAPPHILSCAQISRRIVIHGLLLICRLLVSGSRGCAYCGNFSATWCWSSPVVTKVLPQPRLQPQALFSNYYCARCCILPALFSSVTVSLFQVV